MRYPSIHEADAAHAPGVVFMFAGQGSQYGGMSRDLAAHHPSFRAEYARLQARAAELGAPAGGEALRRRDVRRTHVEIFLAQQALARTLVAHGVRPDYVLGVSMGEIGASVG